MSVLVSHAAPSFQATAVMPDCSFQEIALEQYRGRYVVLFFYPLDFTFVCPTEIIAFSDAASEFEQCQTQLFACSVDSPYTHLAWREKPRAEGGLGTIAFPMISDITKRIASDYGVLLPEQGVALRGLFLIDKEGIVQHELVNNLPLGRNVAETLRMVKELQFTEKYGEVCPANWHEGGPGMKTDAAGSREYFENAYGGKVSV